MEISSDPYEQKLYQIFTSCDINRSGVLDEKALSKLCEMLELQDHGSVIMKGLIKSPRSRVSFEDFKEALLNFLGTEADGSFSPGEQVLIISDETNPKHVDTPHEISDREVSPKLVVGSKKYGRRSRPQMINTDTSPSESEDQDKTIPHMNSTIVQRSSSQNDILSSYRKRPTCSSTKLKRCASLPAQKNQRVREAILDKIKACKAANKNDSSLESIDIPVKVETIPSHSIIEMWDRMQINNSKRLLLSLGFDEDEVNISQLSKVLEEELRGTCGENQRTLLKATLAVQTAELSALKISYVQLTEENKKLHADNKDANRRVAMLAQEIDERHANLEDTARKEIRMLEQRHADIMRDLTTQMANDRETWSTLTARLESKIKQLEQEELRMRTELESTKEENIALEHEQADLQKQITSLLESKIKLHEELAELEERTRHYEGSKNDNETEEMLELVEKIRSLQVENKNLQDKNDELIAEVEGLNCEISRAKAKRLPKSVVTSPSDDAETEHASTAMKRRGDSPSKAKTCEESPRVSKFRRCNADTNSESDTSGDWMALNSELKMPMISTSTPSSSSGFSQEDTSASASNENEIGALKIKITQLEEQLQTYQTSITVNESAEQSVDVTKMNKEKEDLENRCKELESSLEQLRKAYEDCEDYWQDKLASERKLFDNERKIYEEEQRERDVQFTKLNEKVYEYDEQFSKQRPLSPIEEKYTLEQQYTALEAELDQMRDKAQQIFEEKSKEIETLQGEIENLKTKLGENAEILTAAHEQQRGEISDFESTASSPINYLWQQSTIQSPATKYKNKAPANLNVNQMTRFRNLSTSETTVFSTTDPSTLVQDSGNRKSMSPIQKPVKICTTENAKDSEDSSSTASAKSFESQSVATTHSIQKSSSTCTSPNNLKEELKRLKSFKMQLKNQVEDLSFQRDGLIMELQQLQEAKPVLEKAYARDTHPSLLQRVNQLELKNRHLQNYIRQCDQTQQTWHKHHTELQEMQNRLEAQTRIITEQSMHLAKADVFVKELYVENCHLNANIQCLEQQIGRVNLLQHHSLSGLPGMP